MPGLVESVGEVKRWTPCRDYLARGRRKPRTIQEGF